MSLRDAPVPLPPGVLVRRLAVVAGGLLAWAVWTLLLVLLAYAEAAWRERAVAADHPAGGVVNFAALALWLLGCAALARRATPPAPVAVGPYRFVRNPLAWAALLQGHGVAWVFAAALPAVVSAVAVPLLDVVLRPRLEATAARQFGALFVLYRRRVRPWRPRLSAYDPAREAGEPPLAAERTTPPGRYVVLYDGHCRFCAAGSGRLLRLARAGAVERVDFQQPGALDRFPGVTYDACMAQMYLVAPDGRVYGGFEAAVRAVATRPLGKLALLYYVPGVRLLCDLFYRLLAAYRYRLLGKAVAAGGCEGGTCSLHFRKR